MPENSTATRAFWSGTLSFGLVSVPVDLYAANRARSVSLRMLGPKGQPLKRRYVCAQEETPLDKDDLVRGFQTEDGQIVTVSDEELEALEPEKTRDIDLNRFVPKDQISPAYFDRGYYLVPSGASAKAYRLLAATMERTGQAGIATFVMRSKAYVVAIFAEGGFLAAQTLRFHDELREPEAVGLPSSPKVDPKRVAHLKKLIESETLEKFDPESLHDEDAQTLRALAESKLKHKADVVHVEEVSGADEDGFDETEDDGDADSLSGASGKVIDLMQVLRERLGTSGGQKAHRGADSNAGESKRSNGANGHKNATAAPRAKKGAQTHGVQAKKTAAAKSPAGRKPAKRAKPAGKKPAEAKTTGRAKKKASHSRK